MTSVLPDPISWRWHVERSRRSPGTAGWSGVRFFLRTVSSADRWRRRQRSERQVQKSERSKVNEAAVWPSECRFSFHIHSFLSTHTDSDFCKSYANAKKTTILTPVERNCRLNRLLVLSPGQKMCVCVFRPKKEKFRLSEPKSQICFTAGRIPQKPDDVSSADTRRWKKTNVCK